MKVHPALKTACLIAIGISFSYWCRVPLIWLFSTTLLLLVLSILFDKTANCQVFIVFALIAGVSLSYRSSKLIDDFHPARFTINGVITEPPHRYDEWQSFPVRIKKMRNQSGFTVFGPGKIWIRLMHRDERIKPGVSIRFTGVLSPTSPRRNPGDFDLKSWRLRNGYIGEMFIQSSNSVTVIISVPSIPHRIRTAIQEKINLYFRGNSPLVSALILGIRRDLEPEIVDSMRNAGLSHLLALSGLHVGFLIAILFGAATLVRLPYKMRIAFVLICLGLFVIIVPARSSTIRATIMAATFLIGPLLRQQSHPVNSLGVAAMIILCFRPGELFDVGFQLSFAAVGGILLFRPAIEMLLSGLRKRSNRIKRLFMRYALHPFLLSISVSVMVLPLTSFHFGTMAIGAPLFNVIAVPLLGIIYAGSWVVLLFSVISSSVAALMADGMNAILALWGEIILFFGSVAPLYNIRFSPFMVAILLSGIFCAMFIKRRQQIILILIILVGFILQDLLPSPIRFQAWFLDVGHGDASVWRFPSGKVAVIDGGPDRKGNGVGWVEQLLRHYNHREIDLLVASHPEYDHIGGLLEPVSRYNIHAAIASPKISSTYTYTRLCSISTARGLFWYSARTDMNISGFDEEYYIEILGPPDGADIWGSNDASVVLRLTVSSGNSNHLQLLTAGDIEEKGEAALLESDDIRAELLKVSHHGSGTSSSSEFIEAVNPKIAVISRGRSNRYGAKLSPQVIQSFIGRDVELYVTGSEGAILFEPVFNSDNIRWEKMDWRDPSFLRWLFSV